MAWIEAHQTLRTHPKALRFARSLGLEPVHAIGYLLYLWWWCLDYAEDGDLTRYDPEDVEAGIGWAGEPRALWQALHAAGFLVDGCVHDWADYAGRLVQKRVANAERMRAKRALPVTDTYQARAENVTATCGERAAHVQRTCNARAGATEPDLTKPDLTVPTSTDSGDQAAPDAPACVPTDGDDPPARPRPTDPPGFGAFWAAYPRKIGKGAARAWWLKHRPPKALLATMLDAIERQRTCDAWTREGGAYIPHPATWLRQERWEDEPAAAVARDDRNGKGRSPTKDWRGINPEVLAMFPDAPEGTPPPPDPLRSPWDDDE